MKPFLLLLFFIHFTYQVEFPPSLCLFSTTSPQPTPIHYSVRVRPSMGSQQSHPFQLRQDHAPPRQEVAI